MRAFFLILCSLALAARGDEAFQLSPPAHYSGMSEASGAVVVAPNLFLVANDEDNSLRLYRRDVPGEPLQTINLDSFLKLSGKSRKADLEAAARIGDRVFWIGSHSRNKDAKNRPDRHRLFATDLTHTGGVVTIAPVGRPCKTLLHDLTNDPRFAAFDFAAAATIAPKSPGALDIEGLAATPEGHLLIGFRSPVPQGRALLIPLLNPDEVIAARPARFGPAIRLDLGGRGIRDLVRHGQDYLIIAGPVGTGSDFQLYRWAGAAAAPEAVRVERLQEYTPEAIVIYPPSGGPEIQILSDDGTLSVAGVPEKLLADPRRQTFRSFWLTAGNRPSK